MSGLDEAWAEAEAALPEGWVIDSLSHNPDGEWQVFFSSEDVMDAVCGPTPAAALHELAVYLGAAAPAEAREEGPGVCRECGESREAPQHGLDGILAPGTADWAIHVFAAIHQQDTDRAAR